MSAFDTPEIKLSDLARATGRTSNYLSVYIERLRGAGVIDRPARGRVRFTHTTMRGWLHRQRVERGAAVGGFGPPETTTTVKERIIATCRANPEATHAAIAARLGTSPDYVGRVRRADSAPSRRSSGTEPPSPPPTSLSTSKNKTESSPAAGQRDPRANKRGETKRSAETKRNE
ncbi:MAG: hypothetical protein OXG55_06490 [bacterium]|nr:hypothetical protein [bacterium]